MLNNFQTPHVITVPELDMAQLMISFNAPPPIHRSIDDEIDDISSISDIEPTNLLNAFDQVSDHLGAPSPIGPDPNSTFASIRSAYNALVDGINTKDGYSESVRYVMKSFVREIMNAPLGFGMTLFVTPKQDDYEPHFAELTDKIQTGTNMDEVGGLLILKDQFYRAFQGVLTWVNVAEVSNAYIADYRSIMMP